MLKELSWQPAVPVGRPDAAQVADRLVFSFDRDLSPKLLDGRDSETTVVWYRPRGSAAPVLAIQTLTRIEGNNVVVTCDAGDVKHVVEQTPAGTFVIDLNCDLILDGQGAPVSSCSSGAFGAEHLPRPGGILRTWLVVAG